MYDKEFVRSKGKLGRTLPAEHLLYEDKILVVRTRNLSLPQRIIATIDVGGTYNLNRLSNIVARDGYSLYGLLGILNSTLFNWLFLSRFFDYEIKPVYLRASPLADVNDGQLNDLVHERLRCGDRLTKVRTANEHGQLLRKASDLEDAIDSVVFDLYRLSSQERSIVEDQTRSAFGFNRRRRR